VPTQTVFYQSETDKLKVRSLTLKSNRAVWADQIFCVNKTFTFRAGKLKLDAAARAGYILFANSQKTVRAQILIAIQALV